MSAENARPVPLSGGVRAFIDSIRSGLEMPWSMREMSDAEIIECLKKRSGVSQKIAEIDAELQEKETTRAAVGREKSGWERFRRLRKPNIPLRLEIFRLSAGVRRNI
jgi:chorismate mutase